MNHKRLCRFINNNKWASYQLNIKIWTILYRNFCFKIDLTSFVGILYVNLVTFIFYLSLNLSLYMCFF